MKLYHRIGTSALAVLLSGFLFAQTPDTSKINQIHQIGWAFRNSNIDSLRWYAQKELELSKKADYDKGIANANSLLAIFSLYNGQYDQAISHYNIALKTYLSYGLKSQSAATMSNMGNIYLRKADYVSALSYLNKSLKLRQEIGDSLKIASSFAQLGLVHTEIGNYDQGLEFLYNSHQIRTRYKDSTGIAQCLNNIAINYYEQEYFEKAYEFYEEALVLFEEVENIRGVAEVHNNIGEVLLQLEQPDDAMQHFEHAIELFEELGYKKGIVTIFKNMAWVNLKNDELYKARRNCLHALRENIAMTDKEGEIEVLLLLGKIELADQKAEDAISYLQEALDVAKAINSKKNIREIAKELYQSYSLVEDFKEANRFLELYSAYKDSLMDSEKVRAIARLNANYDLEQQKSHLEQKNREIELLQQSRTLETQRSYALGGVALLFVVIAVLIWFRMRFTRKKEQELLLKDKQLAESQKALMEAELKNTQLEGEELKNKLEHKDKEAQEFAIHIVEKNEFIENISKEVEALRKETKDPIVLEKIRELSSKVRYSLSIDRERQEFQKHINQLNSDFFLRLETRFPDITDNEKKLCALLRLGLSSKEIGSILNITPKSVDMNRYRLRKKFEIEKDTNMNVFISNI